MKNLCSTSYFARFLRYAQILILEIQLSIPAFKIFASLENQQFFLLSKGFKGFNSKRQFKRRLLAFAFCPFSALYLNFNKRTKYFTGKSLFLQKIIKRVIKIEIL